MGFFRCCLCTAELDAPHTKAEKISVGTYFFVTMEFIWKLKSESYFFHFGKQLAQTLF